MTVQRQIGFWIAALVVGVLLLFVLRGILLPFVAGFALAYLLDPLADRMQKLGVGRLGASLLILVLFVLVFIIALMILVPFAAFALAANAFGAELAGLEDIAMLVVATLTVASAGAYLGGWLRHMTG